MCVCVFFNFISVAPPLTLTNQSFAGASDDSAIIRISWMVSCTRSPQNNGAM